MLVCLYTSYCLSFSLSYLHGVLPTRDTWRNQHICFCRFVSLSAGVFDFFNRNSNSFLYWYLFFTAQCDLTGFDVIFCRFVPISAQSFAFFNRNTNSLFVWILHCRCSMWFNWFKWDFLSVCTDIRTKFWLFQPE